MFTGVHLCLHLFTYVYHCFTYAQQRLLVIFYLCLPKFAHVYLHLHFCTYVYPRLLVFTYVYLCLPTFTRVSLFFHCLLLHVYICLPLLTSVYLYLLEFSYVSYCLPMFNTVYILMFTYAYPCSPFNLCLHFFTYVYHSLLVLPMISLFYPSLLVFWYV